MSRAFVKEDNEDLLNEELPERPVSSEPNYVTPSGLEQLRGKVEKLQAEHARLKQAAEAFDRPQLSQVERDLRYFQANPVLDQTKVPKLNPEIDKLTFELVTMPLAEQNSVWSQLRAPYHPSLMYRVRMLVFRDLTGAALPPVRKAELHAVRKKP